MSAENLLISPKFVVTNRQHCCCSSSPGTRFSKSWVTSQWRHDERDGVSNHRRLHCLLNWRRSKKTSELRVTGPCAVTGEFPAQKASNAEKLSNWRRHHDFIVRSCKASDKWDSVLKCGHRLGIWQLPRHLWWRHQMETFSALLARCEGNSPVNSPHKGQWRGDLMFSLICA